MIRVTLTYEDGTTDTLEWDYSSPTTRSAKASVLNKLSHRLAQIRGLPRDPSTGRMMAAAPGVSRART